MKVKIDIECDDEKDLFVHLSVIRESMRKLSKRINGFDNMSDGEIQNIEDSSCYGNHTVEIQN